MSGHLPTLQGLESTLRKLDDSFGDTKAKLEGLAFELTLNESLGLGDKKTFNVNIPFPSWPPKAQNPSTSALPECKYPSTLQQVCREAQRASIRRNAR